MAERVAVYSPVRDLIDRIREACPSAALVTDGEERDSCRLAVVDAGQPRPQGKSVVRLFLHEGDPAERRRGELSIARGVFLADPAGFIGFAQDLVAAGMHAAQLENEAVYLRRIQELMTLNEAEEVSERIAETILGLLGLEYASLFLHDPRLERYVVSYSNEPDFEETDEFLPGVPPGILQRAIASPDLFVAERNEEGRGLIVVPLQVEEDLLGVIRIPLGPRDVLDEVAASNVTRYLAAMARVLSNVYQFTRSRDLAMRDDLTKAFNRRFFESHLDEEIERSRRYGTLFSIIFLDLDDLKSVNNLHGHLIGSRTLQEVAKRILGAVRGIDKVVRFGGDEFCVILPQTDADQSVAVANRIARALAGSPLHIDPAIEVSITASFGIATYPTHAMTKEGLVRQADAAMYRVKSTTKNAVGVAVVDEPARPQAT